jgi:hypothetical protein
MARERTPAEMSEIEEYIGIFIIAPRGYVVRGSWVKEGAAANSSGGKTIDDAKASRENQ